MISSPASYTYHVKHWELVLLCCFAIVLGLSLLLFGLFVRGPAAFTYVYLSLSVLCFGATLFVIHTAIRVLFDPPTIEVTKHEIAVPRSRWTRRAVVTPFSKIETMELVENLHGRSLLLRCKDGYCHMIQQGAMKSKEAFQNLWSSVESARRGLRSDNHAFAHRYVPCSLCGDPALVQDDFDHGIRCVRCVLKSPSDFRREGFRVFVSALVVVLACGAVTLGLWRAQGQVYIAATAMFLGVLTMALGIYGMVSGKPIRSAIVQQTWKFD